MAEAGDPQATSDHSNDPSNDDQTSTVTSGHISSSSVKVFGDNPICAIGDNATIINNYSINHSLIQSIKKLERKVAKLQVSSIVKKRSSASTKRCSTSTKRRPLPGSITTQSGDHYATLGAFVWYNGELCCLTSAHSFFDRPPVDYIYNGFNRIDVMQHPVGMADVPFGYVVRAIFDDSMDPGIDVAVVAISDLTRLPTKGMFDIDGKRYYMEAGFNRCPEYMDTSESCNMVVQFGRKTRFTRGSLVIHRTNVTSGREGVTMTNQYEVAGINSTDMFQQGDSGSAVFVMSGTSLQLIGIAIGYMTSGNAVVTPIGAVLKALGPDIRIANFHD